MLLPRRLLRSQVNYRKERVLGRILGHMFLAFEHPSCQQSYFQVVREWVRRKYPSSLITELRFSKFCTPVFSPFGHYLKNYLKCNWYTSCLPQAPQQKIKEKHPPASVRFVSHVLPGCFFLQALET